MYFIDKDILGCKFKSNAINKEDALSLVNSRYEFADSKNILALIDIKNLETVSKEAREIFSEKKASTGIKAAAIVADNPLNKLLANFYLNFNKPPVPIKIFTKQEEARKWLEKQR